MTKPKFSKELAETAGLLQNLEASLSRSWSGQHASFERCDEWCQLWMLLAGSWYSLWWAAHSVEEQSPLKDSLPEAHAFALDFLKSQAPTLAASKMGPWSCGYFLISAEHRIANTIDRLTSTASHKFCLR